jgi:hypothetical protein
VFKKQTIYSTKNWSETLLNRTENVRSYYPMLSQG